MLSYFIKNGAWVFLGNVFLSIFAFATTATLAHILSKEVFGTYRYLLTIIPILAVFTLPDMGPSITRAIAKRLPVNLKEIVWEKIKFGAIGSLIATIISVYYFINLNPTLGYLFLTTAFFIPFFDVFLIYINALYGNKQFKLATIYNISSRLITMVVLLAVAFLTTNIILILVAYFLTQIIPQFFIFQLVKNKNIIQTSSTDTSVIKYGKQLTFIGTISVITASMDKLVVWHFFDAEVLAIYTVALLIAWEGSRMIESLSTVILPFLAEATDKKNITKVLRKIPLLSIFLILCSVFTASIIPFLFPIIFPNYIDSINLAVLSCVLLVFLPLNSILYRYLVAEAFINKMIILQFIKISIFFITFFITINHLNEMAALVSLITCEIILFIFLLLIINIDIRKTQLI
jgi:O-antigen/teichoic acid export membrane protein